MAIARGSKSALRWKEESTYGTIPSGNFVEMSFVSEGMGENVNSIISSEIRSDKTVPSARGGNLSNQGNIVADFSPTRFMKWLQHLLGGAITPNTITVPAIANTTAYLRGDVVTSGVNDYLCISAGTTSGTASADVTGTTYSKELTSGTALFTFMGTTATPKYRHVITGNPDFPTVGLCVEKAVLGGNASQYWDFLGGRIGSLGINVPQEGIVQGTWDFTFAKRPVYATTTSAGTPTTISEDPFAGFDTQIEFTGAGGVASDIREANFTINNNLEVDDFRLGSRFRQTTNGRRREITGSLTAVFEDSTKYDLFRNETKFGLIFTMAVRGLYISFEFPECKIFGDPTPRIGGAGNVTLPFNFTAFRQSSAYDVQVIAKNVTATF